MQTATQALPNSRTTLWAGRIISALVVAFLIFDGVIKVLKLGPAIEATVQLGYPESLIIGIGIMELACLALYVFPRTNVLGAILLTGHLGGAIASQVRIGAPTFNIVFAIMIGVLMWGGIYLRDEQLRALIPLRR